MCTALRKDATSASKCIDCGKDIKAFGKMSAVEVGLFTERKYGRQLCAQCGAKAKELTYSEQSEEKKDIESEEKLILESKEK